MRMRAVVAVVFLAALATSARAESVRLLRYDTTYDNGQHSALCVVPMASTESKRARFVCFYSIPGQAKTRDDTDGLATAPRTAQPVDVNFNVWLTNGLPGAARCSIGAALAAPEFPSKADLKDSCPGAAYVEQTVAGSSATFVNDVRKAVTGTLLLPTVTPAASPVTKTETTSTTSPSPTDTGVSVDTADTVKDVLKDEDRNKGEVHRKDEDHLKNKKQKEPMPPGQPIDWKVLGFLILIAILTGALCIERIAQILHRRQFLKTDVAADENVKAAPNLESAAVMLKRALDFAKRDLTNAQTKLEAAADALENVDETLKLAKGGDRTRRIIELLASETALRQLSPYDSLSAASTDIEARLRDHKAIVDLVRGKDGAEIPLNYVHECTELVEAFSRPFFGQAKGPLLARVAADEIAKVVHGLYTSVNAAGASERAAKEEIAAIAQELRKLREQAAENQSVIQQQRRDVDTTWSFLSEQWPDVVRGDLGTIIPALATRMRNARSAAASVDCATDRGVDAIVAELATFVDRERNASRDTRAILLRLREYLVLPDQDAKKLDGIIAAESGKPSRVLRLALAAAIPVLRTNLAALTAAEDQSVVDMLRIGEIARHLDAFLGRLWECDGDQLWASGIQAGFAQNWLNRLFRAEAVLRTYFMASRLAELGDVLAVVAWAFRYASAASGYELDRVQLLAAPSPAMDPVHESPRELKGFPDVRNRVQSLLKTQRDGGFAIDVDAVGIRGANRVIVRGAVVLAKRVDWED